MMSNNGRGVVLWIDDIIECAKKERQHGRGWWEIYERSNIIITFSIFF
jgi:hypothetical protein